MNEGIHESDEVEEERKEREREDQVGYTSIFAHDPVSRQGIHGAAWEEPTAELTYLASCRIGRSWLTQGQSICHMRPGGFSTDWAHPQSETSLSS